MKLSDLNDFLQFGRRVRLAFFGLLIFSVVFLLLPLTYPFILNHFEPVDFSATEAAAAEIKEKIDSGKGRPGKEDFPKKFKPGSYAEAGKGPSPSRRKSGFAGNRFSAARLFSFNPNSAGRAELLRLGFSKKTAQTLLNYRNKGGVFYKKEDFRKVYGISESDYQLLEPFISIPRQPFAEAKVNFEKPASEKSGFKKKSFPVSLKIDVNKADESEWQTLRGIGPYYAKTIVNFREKLGGFSSIEQIGTTYNLKDSTFQIIKPFLEISPVYKKIKINTASWEELRNHPYIKGKQARILEQYRQNHGPFADFESLNKVIVFSEEELERLRPYLDFSD